MTPSRSLLMIGILDEVTIAASCAVAACACLRSVTSSMASRIDGLLIVRLHAAAGR